MRYGGRRFFIDPEENAGIRQICNPNHERRCASCRQTTLLIKEFSAYGRAEGIDFSVNLLNLSFYDTSIEGRFQEAYFQNNLSLGRICHLLAIFFYVTVGLWDAWYVEPGRMTAWIWVGAIVSLVFLLGLAASYLLTPSIKGTGIPCMPFTS